MLRHFLSSARSRRHVFDALVRQVAEASVDGVCRLSAQRIVGMGPCEARGYLRARSGMEIRRQTELAFSRDAGVDPTWQAAVAARAADRVPALALRRLSAATARISVPQRRAA